MRACPELLSWVYFSKDIYFHVRRLKRAQYRNIYPLECEFYKGVSPKSCILKTERICCENLATLSDRNAGIF